MARRHYRSAEIIAKLREADVMLAEGTKVSDLALDKVILEETARGNF